MVFWRTLRSDCTTNYSLVLRLPPRASISLTMQNRLHCLPFPQRVTFKLCMMAYKSQHGLLPHYVTQMYTGTGTLPAQAKLRSTVSGHMIVPEINMQTVGRRGFFYACPSAWNSLPHELTADCSLSIAYFRRNLKTFFVSVTAFLHTAHL